MSQPNGQLTVEPLTVEVHRRAILGMLMNQRQALAEAEGALDEYQQLSRRIGGHPTDDAIAACLRSYDFWTQCAESSARGIAGHRAALLMLGGE